MSNFTAPKYNATPPDYIPSGIQPPAPKKKAWFKQTAVLVTAGVLFGLIAGSASAKPEVVTVEKPVEKIVEKITTPASCITALELSEQGFTYAAEIIGYLNDGIQAAGRLNAAGLNEASEKMGVVNPKLGALAPKMRVAAADCRASK